jgi:hypothetical protein
MSRSAGGRFGAPYEVPTYPSYHQFQQFNRVPDIDNLVAESTRVMTDQAKKRLLSGAFKLGSLPFAAPIAYQGAKWAGDYIYDTASQYNPFSVKRVKTAKAGQLGGKFYGMPKKNNRSAIDAVYVARSGGAEYDVSTGVIRRGGGYGFRGRDKIAQDLIGQGVAEADAWNIATKAMDEFFAKIGDLKENAKKLFGEEVVPKARASSAKPYMSTMWLRKLPQYKRMLIKRYFDKKGEGSNFTLFLHTGVKNSHKIDKYLKQAVQLYKI